MENLDVSLGFYRDVVGFKILVSTTEARYVYMDFEGAHLMIEEADGPGERYHTTPLENPYGRGSSLRIEVDDLNGLYDRIVKDEVPIVSTIEDRWYRHNDMEKGNWQFVVADPDGYLLRFFKDLGKRTIQNA